MTTLRIGTLSLIFTFAWPLAAAQRTPVDRLLDQVVRLEQSFMEALVPFSPIVETYIQEIPEAEDGKTWPNRDHYFLGRIDLRDGFEYTSLVARSEQQPGSGLLFFRKKTVAFVPSGFAQMIYLDAKGFSREAYGFEYIRREFLGEVRCLVFDVAPKDTSETGRFIGRIWVEDRGYHVVRFNGTYTNSTPSRLFFHFDSWRIAVGPGQWVPALVYVEESSPRAGESRIPRFKAQTRLWGYQPSRNNRLDELTNILIESESLFGDEDAGEDVSPLSSQRLWEQQAEENVIDRLVNGGLMAPESEVDEVLNTVVSNLVVTNSLSSAPKCRVLLTTPLESFSLGNTIVMSRGLIDVLPDEASLAMVLAGELAHIALGHPTNTQFAFNDQTMLSDVELLEQFRFFRSEAEIDAAARKAVEILQNSPYQEKIGNAGLFLKALSQSASQFPNLIRANLGNQLTHESGQAPMRQLIDSAPALELNRLDQIAALPLGSRVKLDPWTNQILLIKTEAVALKSARDKLPFEVTPFQVRLSYQKAEPAGAVISKK